MKMTNHLPHPYKDADRDELVRVSIDITPEDNNLLKFVCPDHGLKMRLGQLFFADLCAELRENNIQYYSPENEQYFLRAIQKRLTTLKSPYTTDGVNDDRRVEGERKDIT